MSTALAEGPRSLDNRMAERHPTGHSYGPDGPSERLVNVPPTQNDVKRHAQRWFPCAGPADDSKNIA